jgi:protein-tyrosine phosphatase
MALIPLNLPPSKSESVNEIVDNIFLGNYHSRLFVKELKINRIVEIGTEEELKKYEKYYPTNLEKLPIVLEDSRKSTILPLYEFVIDFIKKDREYVLIHCSAGVSRSVSFVIAYLMKEKGMKLDKAISYISSKRTIYTRPNVGFMRELRGLSQELESRELV